MDKSVRYKCRKNRGDQNHFRVCHKVSFDVEENVNEPVKEKKRLSPSDLICDESGCRTVEQIGYVHLKNHRYQCQMTWGTRWCYKFPIDS